MNNTTASHLWSSEKNKAHLDNDINIKYIGLKISI